ncbi:MAG: hypothetical protein K6G61_00355 [Solobacterium sp.]|nr:hypothetical protein [Solobacterium sp.]
MKISEKDSDKYFELFFPLLDYANRKYSVIRELRKVCFEAHVPSQYLRKITDSLWADNTEPAEYLRQYGDTLSEEDRSIIEGFSKRICGDFILLKHLPKGTVFIAKDHKVYIVKGLKDTWEELLFFKEPPAFVNMTILPFKGQLITDGIPSVSQEFMPLELERKMNSIYLQAKKNKEIITSIG